MPVRFCVHHTFTLLSRRMFVITGEIVEGTVRVGMQVEVPLNDAVRMTAPLEAVEFVDGPDRQGRVALGVRYDDEVGLAMWRGLNLAPGEVLTISEPRDGGAADPVPPPRRPWWKLWQGAPRG